MAEILLVTNPSSTVEPVRQKTIIYQNTLGTGGNTILFELQDEGLTIQWSGHFFTEAEYTTLVGIYDARVTSTFTDDLGRSYTVYVTAFIPKREGHSPFLPWHHTYTLDMMVLAEL